MKAKDQRGLSAGRSINHFQELLWLLGDDDILDLNYTDYGIANLKKIAEKYNIPFVAEDEIEDE